MPKLVEDGDWVLYDNRGEYVCIHRCMGGAFSWEEGPQWTATGRFDGLCMGCQAPPPERMQGFVNLLEWER